MYRSLVMRLLHRILAHLHVCLSVDSLCVSPVIDWPPVQGVAQLYFQDSLALLTLSSKCS